MNLSALVVDYLDFITTQWSTRPVTEEGFGVALHEIHVFGLTKLQTKWDPPNSTFDLQ